MGQINNSLFALSFILGICFLALSLLSRAYEKPNSKTKAWLWTGVALIVFASLLVIFKPNF